MYAIMILANGRKAIKSLTEGRREAIMAYTAKGLSSLFVRGYTLTNAL